MNKAIGLGIGIAIVVIAFVVAGSTIFTDTELNPLSGLPNEDENKMMLGDKVSVKVTPADDTIDEVEEGKNIEVSIVDGVSATSTP